MNQYKSQCFFCSPYDKKLHSKIETEIINNEFKKDSIWGFRVYSRRNDTIQAVYIEKKTYIEKIIDPFGEIQEFNRVTYNQIDFQLSIVPPHILLFQPPREYRKLLNQLAQFADYTIAIDIKVVKLLDWVDLIINQGFKCIVKKANINSINYDKYTSGKLTLVSGVDLKDKIDKLIPNSSYSLKQLSISFCEKSDIPNVDLFSDGKIIFTQPVDLDIFKILYDSFCKLVNHIKLGA